MTARRTASRLALTAILLAGLLLTDCGDTVNVNDGVTVIPGLVQVRTQSELSLLTGVEQVLGHLKIGPDVISDDPIRDLSPLRNLVYVAWDLQLSGLDELGSLRGLANLEQVGGRLDLSELEMLRSLDGLENLRDVGFGLSITENPRLESIAGLSGLRGVLGGQWSIQSNPSLTSLHGLEGIEALAKASGFDGALGIRYCESLVDLAGLDALAELHYLAISDCPSLADIGALGRLRHVGSQLRLATLPSLTSLDGLEALEECPAVYLYDVPGVASLQPLAPINLSVLDLENTGTFWHANGEVLPW